MAVAETANLRRRTPRQRRSREIVAAIVEAGLRLLRAEGPKALTTNRIAECAGVSIGSLYRYFSNKESVVAAIYEAFTASDVADLRAAGWMIDELPLRDALAAIVDFQLARHRAYLALNADFYRVHHREFSLSARVDMRALDDHLRALLARQGATVRVRDLDHAAFLLGRGISAILRCAIEERPETFSDPDFRDELVDLAFAYVTTARASPHPAKSNAASR